MATDALKPQDVFVACQIALLGETPLTQLGLAEKLHLSTSTVFEALGRLKQAKLAILTAYQPAKILPGKLLDFLVHGVPTIYFPKRIEIVRGIPTSIFSPLFRDRFAKDGLRPEGQRSEILLVWPYSKGKEMGEGLLPLYPTVPIACSQDPELYQLMAAIDVHRVGRSREREAAVAYLEDFFKVTLDKRTEEPKETV
jgi:hypothetical protein